MMNWKSCFLVVCGFVDTEDIKTAAKLVLPHRMRRRPFEEGELDWGRVDELISTGV